jgi:S1-C subfamily serine protease
LIVARISPLSPFAAAGLETGDILVEIEGNTISTPAELEFRLAALGVGREADMVYLRDGEPRFATVTLSAPPDTPPRDVRNLSGPSPLDGLRVANLNPAMAEELGLGLETEGVIILNASRDALRAGFRKGDLIVEVNEVEILSTAQLADIARRRTGEWRITIEREGRRGALKFRG